MVETLLSYGLGTIRRFKRQENLRFWFWFWMDANHFAKYNDVFAIEPNTDMIKHRQVSNIYNLTVISKVSNFATVFLSICPGRAHRDFIGNTNKGLKERKLSD
ncbi:MAG TPA: hypothetical protein VGC17_06985 [Lactovum miscens]|uniref:hypothetical protein n=1 Tax=Lactovum miscens TaxID=190387 RepID=UPI002EDA02F7